MLETIKLKEEITEIRSKMEAIKDKVISEQREMTSEEEEELNTLRAEIDEKDEEIKKLREQIDEQIKKKEEEETKACDDEEKEEDKRNLNKYISRNKMKKLSLVKEIRKAIDEKTSNIKLNAETRAVQVTGDSGVHDEVVETEIEGILTGLYPNSILEQLGVRMYTGAPRGDIQIPIMSKNTVKWEGETDEADATGNTFTTVKLSPKRLSAYIDISKQLIYQDNIGVEAAIRADLVRALRDKIEATMFGDAAGTTEKPAGLFYGQTPTECTTFADICDFEADLEDANVYGNMQYAMNPKAKAGFRATVKGNNNSGFVYEAGEMDGIPTHVTTNIADNMFIYGDFSDVVVSVWNDLDLTIDTVTQATKGCVRIVINAYVDFKVARGVCLGFGEYVAPQA